MYSRISRFEMYKNNSTPQPTTPQPTTPQPTTPQQTTPQQTKDSSTNVVAIVVPIVALVFFLVVVANRKSQPAKAALRVGGAGFQG